MVVVNVERVAKAAGEAKAGEFMVVGAQSEGRWWGDGCVGGGYLAKRERR